MMKFLKKAMTLVVAIAALYSLANMGFATVKANAAAPSVSYYTHVQDYGWQGTVADGAVSGTSGESKRLEAICIGVGGVNDLGVTYQTHVENYGWLDWTSNGQMNGTEGQALRLEAIRIKLTGGNAANYDIFYRVHVQNIGWLDWVANGELAGTTGMSLRLEAIQIAVVAKGSGVPANLDYSSDGSNMAINYKTHVENYGWIANVRDGQTGGTSGQSLRLEGIKIRVVNAPVSGGVTYRTHVQNYGWLDWVSDGALSGTTGEALRLEALQVKLTGELANQYDVYYRVHIQNYGWLDWAKNGAMAGSSGLAMRLEAVEIKYVPKGSGAPGAIGNSYIGNQGIDVSKWQGNIDWNQVATAGKSFAMVRFFDRSTGDVDAYFYQNVKGAQAVGMNVGAYVYATARNTDQAAQEAAALVNSLRNNGISLQYPIAYDVESDIYQGGLSPSEVTDLILAFKNVVESNGYKFMLYANKNWLTNRIDMSRLQDVDLWLAEWINDEKPTYTYESDRIVMWQYGKTNSVSGIKGDVDLDIAF